MYADQVTSRVEPEALAPKAGSKPGNQGRVKGKAGISGDQDRVQGMASLAPVYLATMDTDIGPPKN